MNDIRQAAITALAGSSARVLAMDQPGEHRWTNPRIYSPAFCVICGVTSPTHLARAEPCRGPTELKLRRVLPDKEYIGRG